MQASATEGDNRSFFRCPISDEKRSVTVRLGRKTIAAEMLEESISGFTLAVPKNIGKKAKSAKKLTVEYDAGLYEVEFESSNPFDKGRVRIGVRRVRDLTKPATIKNTFLTQMFAPSLNAQSAAVAYGGFVLVLFSVLAMPGLGEKLGTAPRIEAAAKSMYFNIKSTFTQWLR